jgi:hypothetical protein
LILIKCPPDIAFIWYLCENMHEWLNNKRVIKQPFLPQNRKHFYFISLPKQISKEKNSLGFTLKNAIKIQNVYFKHWKVAFFFKHLIGHRFSILFNFDTNQHEQNAKKRFMSSIINITFLRRKSNLNVEIKWRVLYSKNKQIFIFNKLRHNDRRVSFN